MANKRLTTLYNSSLEGFSLAPGPGEPDRSALLSDGFCGFGCIDWSISNRASSLSCLFRVDYELTEAEKGKIAEVAYRSFKEVVLAHCFDETDASREETCKTHWFSGSEVVRERFKKEVGFIPPLLLKSNSK